MKTFGHMIPGWYFSCRPILDTRICFSYHICMISRPLGNVFRQFCKLNDIYLWYIFKPDCMSFPLYHKLHIISSCWRYNIFDYYGFNISFHKVVIMYPCWMYHTYLSIMVLTCRNNVHLLCLFDYYCFNITCY